MMKPRRVKHTRSYSESSIKFFNNDFNPVPNGPNINPNQQQRNFMNNNQPRKFIPPPQMMNGPPDKMRGPPIPPGTYTVLQIRKFLNDTIVEQQRLHHEFIQRNADLEKKQKYLVNLLLRHSHTQNNATQKIKQLRNYNNLLQQQEAQREMFMRNMVNLLNMHGNNTGSPTSNHNGPKLNIDLPLHQQILNQQYYHNMNQRDPTSGPNSGPPRVGQIPMGQNRPSQGFNRTNQHQGNNNNNIRGNGNNNNNNQRLVVPPPRKMNNNNNNNNRGGFMNMNRMKVAPNFNTMNLQLPLNNQRSGMTNNDIITPPTGSDPSQDEFFGGRGLGGLGGEDDMGNLLDSPEELKKPSRPFSPDPMGEFDEGMGAFDETSFNNFTNPDDDELPLADLDLPDLSLRSSGSGNTNGPPQNVLRGNDDDDSIFDEDGQFPGMEWNHNLTPMSPPTPDRKVKRIKHESRHRRTQSFNENFLSQHY